MCSDNYVVSSKIRKEEAHIWSCNPDDITDATQLNEFEQLLSEDETAQYERFHSSSDQHQYLVSHALVRTILSKYANLLPNQWSFKKNKHGRPEIEQITHSASLRFNLTHTQGFSACVVTFGVECGIDAEMLERRANNLENVAAKMFSQSELEILTKVSGSEYKNLFFKLWTLRESYVKALGTGLASSTKDYSFVMEGTGATIKYDNNESRESKRWQFSVFEPTSQHIATVALQANTTEQLTIINQVWQFD